MASPRWSGSVCAGAPVTSSRCWRQRWRHYFRRSVHRRRAAAARRLPEALYVHWLPHVRDQRVAAAGAGWETLWTSSMRSAFIHRSQFSDLRPNLHHGLHDLHSARRRQDLHLQRQAHRPGSSRHPLHPRRRHRAGHLGRQRARARCGGGEGLRRQEARSPGSRSSPARNPSRRIQQLAARRHRRGLPGISRRHQGPADHAGRRRHPLAQCRAAPDARSLRLPAPGAVFHRRALAREASRRRWTWSSSAKTPRTSTRASISQAARRKRRRSSISSQQGISRRISRKSASAPQAVVD